ncbi:nicotinamide mononucleotide transporter [Arcobacter acticola]|uniref:Nicotinamide riboside transporter PnuC n=1 Tax=Arcobacter acticola TaxID=1849015 RepID=A0A6M8EV85_9BACT|nr:nicotinamide riboside transporter PnuC [Arcobacter acticola]QKE28465.1 nicotinamide mononucleotide transporter [Arcobacter acticola]
MTSWEMLAVFLSVSYILLAIKQNLWSWVAAFFSTLIYSILFFDASLLMDSALNIFYLVMAVYGWYSWKYGNIKAQNEQLKITTYGITNNFKIIGILILISIVLGYIMANYTSADFAYLDTFTTVFAVFATYMLAKKVLENWIYWVVIDTVSIYIYIQKGFYLTAVLFAIYTVLACVAYIQWKKEYKNLELKSA